MQKVAIYCRLSDEDKNKQSDLQDSESIQNQKTMLISYAMQNEWEVYDLYSDDDYSGADAAIARPEFERLIRDAENKKFDIVLAKTQSRFTRDMEIVEKYLHNKFIQWGIRFISLVDNTDTFNKANKKSRQINGLTNEWYLEDLSDNIKAVLNSKKRQGKFIGAFASYGYKKTPGDKNKLIIDEPAAEVVRTIFKLYLEGYGLTRIAHYLNEQGFPCPTEYKRLNGENYRPSQQGMKGRIWRDTSISSILKNQIYCGDMVQGKTGTISYKNSKKVRKASSEWIIIENTHEPIICREIFERVGKAAGTRTRPESTGKKHIFSGKLRCAECNSVLVKKNGRKSKDGLSLSKSFVCPIKKYGICPNGATASYHLVYEKVHEEIQKIIHAYVSEEDISNLIMERDVINEKIESIHKTMLLLEQQGNDIDSALENLYLDKVRGILTETQFVNMSQRFSEKHEKLSNQKKAHSEELKTLNGKVDFVDEKKAIVEKYVNMSQLSKEIIDEFIESIHIKNTEYIGVKEITITWNL